MTGEMGVPAVHLRGEQPAVELAEDEPVAAETFAGRVHLEWEPAAPVTTMGQLAFFIEYLKQGGLFDGWVAGCPLNLTSPNAPAKRDVLSDSSEDTMPEQTNGTDLFEIIKTTRSMRRLKPDPVPNELIRKILEAGVCAPSGGNMQRWRFLVIRDAKIKETIGALYKRAWDEQVAPRYRSGEPAPGTSRERFERMLAAEYLAAHIHEAPVWIVPCLEGATPTCTSGSSIYPAVQNMLLAARALGAAEIIAPFS